MKTPSGPPPKGTISWWGPLVTVSLFTFWNTPLFAQLTMESVPVNVAEGRAVLLLVHNLPENPYGYSWYKGGKVQISHQILAYRTQTQTITPGVAHSGRETIYPNGTLLFQNVTLRDTGTYTLQVLKKHFQRELVSGQFHVYPQGQAPGLSPGVIAGIVTGVLAGVAVVAALGCNGDQAHSAGIIIGIVIAVLVGVFLVAALAYFLFLSRTRGLFIYNDPLYVNQAAVPIYEYTAANMTARVVTRKRAPEEDLPE
ncbi:cell adhesion molecule CEACAM3-like [Tenrec ecaudatus]|uniref:cell adhesion molecule CEACAM3-like n=1 Tax=Tenrec ecaudatus TaxID=94439 RepID=UPI003F5A3BAE